MIAYVMMLKDEGNITICLSGSVVVYEVSGREMQTAVHVGMIKNHSGYIITLAYFV